MHTTDKLTIAGVEFVSPAACSFGDYGGYGSLGLANIRAIVSSPDAGEVVNAYMGGLEYDEDVIAAVNAGATVIHATGGYSSETVWLRADSDLARETLEALESCPSLDDEASSMIELEWESEAWGSWLRFDLERKCWPDDTPDGFDAMPDGDKFSAYRFAMEVENIYPEAEYSGVYVDVERIAATYAATVARMLAGETIDAIHRAQWPSVYAARG